MYAIARTLPDMEVGTPLTTDQHALVQSCLRLAYLMALRVRNMPRYQRMGFPETLSAAQHGLVLAAQRFNPDLGFQFTTYATWWVRCSLQTAAREYGRDKAKLSVDVAVSHEDDTDEIFTTLPAKNTPNWHGLLREELEACLEKIAAKGDAWPRYAHVLRLRYFDGLNLREIGNLLQLSKERIRQIERVTLEALREVYLGEETVEEES